MTLRDIFCSFPNTRGIDVVRLYISTPYGTLFTHEFDFDCRKSWWDNFKGANLSDKFLADLSNVLDFEFRIENESIVLEIQAEEIRQYGY